MESLDPYGRMILPQCFFTDRQSVIEKMGRLFVLVLIPKCVRKEQNEEMT